MLKGFKYNQDLRIIKGKSKYTEEHNALCDFCASEHKNIRFEYATVQEAKNASNVLRMWIKTNRKPLTVMQRNNFCFAIKTIKDINDIKEEE